MKPFYDLKEDEIVQIINYVEGMNNTIAFRMMGSVIVNSAKEFDVLLDIEEELKRDGVNCQIIPLASIISNAILHQNLYLITHGDATVEI